MSETYAQVSQGAEAKVWTTQFLQRPAIIKQRFKKRYRHPTLDAALTSQRLKAEVRCMLRARKLGVRTPVPYHVESSASAIYMEHVQGQTIKQVRHCDLLADVSMLHCIALARWRVTALQLVAHAHSISWT